MNEDSDNLRFRCAFSEDGVEYFNMKYWAVAVLMLVLGVYFVILTGVWICLVVILLVIIIPSVYRLIYVEKLVEESYLEITPDGTLNCVYKWRGTAKYPVKEILSIEVASFKDRGFNVPKSLSHYRDPELYPDEGVLIYFNRKWIKSIYPVFFNPEDIQGFICAMNQKREELAAAESAK